MMNNSNKQMMCKLKKKMSILYGLEKMTNEKKII
jgi:hypothetical protein